MTTPIAGLPEISENQANKAITHNTALRQLEINLGAVISRTLTTPPSSPAEGALYIVPTGASGAWSGQTNKIAQWSNGGWNIYIPFQYQRLYSIADSAVIIYVGASWSVFNSSGGGSGDMLKSIYDTDNDGIVDNAESVIDGAITTTKIANDAVTYGKIQNVTTNRLLGRVSAGNGDTEEIIIGAGLSVSGTTLSATGGSGGGREKLTANRIYYVRTDGSDSNNGLTNDSAGAFLTIQKAIDTVAFLDINIFNVEIILTGSFTFSESIQKHIVLKDPFSSGGIIKIKGSTDVATDTVLNWNTSLSNNPIFFECSNSRLYTIENIHINVTQNNNYCSCLIVKNQSFIYLRNVRFTLSGNSNNGIHLRGEGNSLLTANNLILSGSLDRPIVISQNSSFIYDENSTLTTISLNIGDRAILNLDNSFARFFTTTLIGLSSLTSFGINYSALVRVGTTHSLVSGTSNYAVQ